MSFQNGTAISTAIMWQNVGRMAHRGIEEIMGSDNSSHKNKEDLKIRCILRNAASSRAMQYFTKE